MKSKLLKQQQPSVGEGAQQTNPADVLTALGMDSAEVSIYQTVLALGTKPASAIATRAGLKRGQTYNVLERLIQQGLVQEGIRNGTRHFTSSHPRTLLSLLDQRENELKLQREKVLEVIPQLEDVRRSFSGTPRIRLFQGIAGAIEVLEEMLEDEGELLAIIDSGTVFLNKCQGTTTNKWHEEFVSRRVKRGISFYGIVNLAADRDYEDYSLRSGESCLRKLKMVSGLPLAAEFIISNSKLGLISTVGETVSILIENKNISQAAQQIFWLLWRIMPEYASQHQETTDKN